MLYSPYVQPITSAGVKCVVVDIRLKEIEPMAYSFLLNFAKDNELQVRPGRGENGPTKGPEDYPGIALSRAASRLLCRAASFLWMTFLSAIRSMIPRPR